MENNLYYKGRQSKMFLLAEVPYGKKLLFPFSKAEVLDQIKIVETRGYNHNMEVFLSDEVLVLELVQENQLKLTEEDSTDLLKKKLEDANKNYSLAISQRYELEEELKKLKSERKKEGGPHFQYEPI